MLISRIPLVASRVTNALSTRQSANHCGLPPAVTASVMRLRLVLSAVISGGSPVSGGGANSGRVKTHF